MSVSRRWTVADLEQIEPKETERYEIIDGELIVTHAPSWGHQSVCGQFVRFLGEWSDHSIAGVVVTAPGVIFSPENAVVPDVVWISFERLRRGTDRAGHFVLAPELAIEVLSPGLDNERRDRQTKLALYSREGVDEYWIVDWQRRMVEVYRLAGTGLELVQLLGGDDLLESPLLAGFRVPISRLWPPTL
jgi:Uma2 family endonuclease